MPPADYIGRGSAVHDHTHPCVCKSREGSHLSLRVALTHGRPRPQRVDS
jgi:hypothetical protein